MNSNLSNKLQSQKPGQIENLIEDLDKSTKGSDQVSANTKPRQLQTKLKSTSSLPESLASTKIYESKNALNELKEMFKQ